ncbi:MAG: hypothetical protein A3G34_13595 [Candidatus Lindowbacteria bacterium RIFCSPLOWO2_12_FULL_62_27]|nr:MAG: hypothetical protein A3I06_00465 [Candidatus Lindowbacteria bacterium RIFCSPLOWO2_02_FULL_62_12]OGH62615.1 MAG: hypothetical protein A3G34_13595 [Candidatus Lindowbacteria bacterium RIFCSPLOWO2_12_FULL_62_27]
MIDELRARAMEFAGIVRRRLPRALEGTDPEDVHKLRVASRRLRESLRILDRLAPDKGLRRWQRTVRRITREAGSVRELDVALWFLRSSQSPLPGAVRGAARKAVEPALLVRLDRVRRRFRRALTPSPLRGFRLPAGKGPTRPSKNWDSILARLMVEERFRQARRRYGRIRGSGDVRRMHRFRISVKKLRYTVELLSPYLPLVWRDRLDRIKKLQSVLGGLHDDFVTAGMLRKAVRGMEREKSNAVSRANRAIRAHDSARYAALRRLRLPWHHVRKG